MVCSGESWHLHFLTEEKLFSQSEDLEGHTYGDLTVATFSLDWILMGHMHNGCNVTLLKLKASRDNTQTLFICIRQEDGSDKI